MNAIAAAVGAVVGAVLTWALTQSRGRRTLEDQATLRATLKASEANLLAANEAIARERDNTAALLAGLETTFEATSNRVLQQTVQHFSQSQEQVLNARDARFKDNLDPLKDLLAKYESNLSAFDRNHLDALSSVKQGAAELLEAQKRTQEETRRLNQLLGRSDQRGRWGEIQLANVLEASGLRPGIDYVLQSSTTNDAGTTKRPDCIISMPNHTSVVVDAKFPFDDFEKSLTTEDPEERRQYKAAFAKKLRGHVKELKSRSYWDELALTPAFTVCFVPSDAALSAAFEADAALHDYAIGENVLIVGPTNLLALLWSAAMVLRQHDQTVNAQEILEVATELYERIATVATHIARLGKSLNDTTGHYNKVVASVETRLLSTARRVRTLGVARQQSDVTGLTELTEPARALDEAKWGVDLNDPELEARSEVLDLHELDDTVVLDESAQ